jgi:DNA (cytosine-5)-methyltransferase 1
MRWETSNLFSVPFEQKTHSCEKPLALSQMKIDAIDLFCGAGGLSYGLQEAGLSVRLGVDLDPRCDYPFTSNIRHAEFLLSDVGTATSQKLERYYRPKSKRLLAGCAPCQPFSTLRNGIKRETSDKWPLLNEFSRLAAELKPDFVTMENVPVLKTQQVFIDFTESLRANGFYVTYGVVDAAKYGVPQRRNRLVLLASRYGPIRLLSPEELQLSTRTVRDAIGRLPSLRAGETSKQDRLHKARALTEINMERIVASKPGGTWESWPDRLKLACHKKQSGSTFKSVYGRMEWDKPSSTITTQATNFGTGRFGHPTQDRALSLREMATLQSFPIDYKFVADDADVEFTPLGRLIGNAVPVNLGYAVGKSITHHSKTIDPRHDK